MFKVFKKFKSFFAIAMSMVMGFTLSGVSASAYSDVTQPIGAGRCKNGIGNIHYYITDSILNHAKGSTIISTIDAAANSWVYTGYGYNPLYMYRTYDFYASNIDFYATDQIVEGFTRSSVTFWQGTSANPVWVNPGNSDWSYTEVKIYVAMIGDNQQKLQRAVAKAIGHSLGLDENKDNSNSVMCDFSTECYVYKPGIMDHNGLVAMYS